MTFETYLIDPLKRKTYVTLSEKTLYGPARWASYPFFSYRRDAIKNQK